MTSKSNTEIAAQPVEFPWESDVLELFFCSKVRVDKEEAAFLRYWSSYVVGGNSQ